MSKDAKVGFAIGGVLLAVLVVYLVVVPRHHRVVHPTVAVVTPPAGTAPVNPALSEPSAPLVETPTTAPALAVATADKPVESVTPLIPSPSTPTAEPLTAPASPLADATPAHGTDDWNKLFPSQSSAPGLMASDSVPQTGRGASANAGGSSALTDSNEDSSSHSVVAEGSRSSRHRDRTETASAASAGRQYTVRSGETLSSIAADVYGNARYYVSIERANPSVNPNRLKVGTKLSLPISSDVKPLATASRGSDASGSNESSDATASASSYASGGPAGGGIILASPVTSQTDTVVSSETMSDPNGFYTVKRGDTLFGISKKLYGNLHNAAVIYSVNKTVIGPDKAKLKVGTVLQLPSTGALEAAANAAQ